MRPPSSSSSSSSSASQELNSSSAARLKINKESHSIHKYSPNSSTTSSSSSVITSTDYNHHEPPVVIYTHSPKIIHTEARDFMALVQKLTGMSRQPSDRDVDVHRAAADHDLDASFEGSYNNKNVDGPQVSCSTSISTPSCLPWTTDPLSPPDQTDTTTMSMVSVVAPDDMVFLPEDQDPYLQLGYHDQMSENSPSAFNSWIHLTFAYGDQESLF